MTVPAVQSSSACLPSFYVVGGSLPRNAASYVLRQADEALLAALQRSEFCYILTSRQMGKSSLMIRAVMRLEESGTQAVVIDLTALGQNLTAEQWYKGMLNRMASQLNLEDELDDFWEGCSNKSPLDRWMTALQQIVLVRIREPLVIFIDEIDMVRSLPFPTDEFFAGIRACYNHRDIEPTLNRVTFCLLGVASPSDLIQDVQITPFNIGRRIELQYFTTEEARILSFGIPASGRSGETLLRRVLYWTGGHPYLTQRVCEQVAENANILLEPDVDRLCDALFSRAAVQIESNLSFVSNRILRSGLDIAGLLELYQRVYVGERVADDSTNPLCEALRLSGIVSRADGALKVRNRIYAQVFDKGWIQANMPNAELQRQKQAYRKGLLHALAICSAVLVAMIILIAIVSVTYRDAHEQRHHNKDRLFEQGVSTPTGTSEIIVRNVPKLPLKGHGNGTTTSA